MVSPCILPLSHLKLYSPLFTFHLEKIYVSLFLDPVKIAAAVMVGSEGLFEFFRSGWPVQHSCVGLIFYLTQPAVGGSISHFPGLTLNYIK